MRRAWISPTCWETLDIRRRVLGPEHPDTLKSMSNLGEVLIRQGQYAEAARLLGETLDIKRRVLGPDHPSTTAALYNLGCISAMKGNRPDALSFLRQAIDHGLSPTGKLGMEKDDDLKALNGDARFVALVAYAKKVAAASRTSE